ncbi:MAG: FixH family protein [Casimicrobiaceae bacterium]
MSQAVSSAHVRPVSKWIWPGLLIAGPAAVIVASAITAIFVLRHPDGLVAQDYYKQGKAINAKLHQLEAARELGLAQPAIRAESSVIHVRFARPEMREPIAWVLAHPVDPDRDLRGLAHPVAGGEYRIELPTALDGHRNLLLTDAAGVRWRVEARL